MVHPSNHLSGLPWAHPKRSNVLCVLPELDAAVQVETRGKEAMTTAITWPTVPFLHSQSGWASGCGASSELLGIYCKRRGSVPSVVVCGLAGIKLSFIFSALVHHSLKKTDLSFSKAQGCGSWCCPSAHFAAGHQEIFMGFGQID